MEVSKLNWMQYWVYCTSEKFLAGSADFQSVNIETFFMLSLNKWALKIICFLVGQVFKITNQQEDSLKFYKLLSIIDYLLMWTRVWINNM